MLGTTPVAIRSGTRRFAQTALIIGSFAIVTAACGGSDSESTPATRAPTGAPTTTGAPAPTTSLPATTTTTPPTTTTTTTEPPAPDLPASPVVATSPQPALGIDHSAGASFDESRLDTETTPFVALDEPVMVPASHADWLDDDDIVLGFVHDSGEAHAFPTSQMSFHHVANIAVAGEPYLVTF